MILCCGEALIDMLPRQTSGGETAFLPCAGGAVFNTALALGRLGATTGLFAGISTDLMGEILTAKLLESGVDLSYAPRSDRPTTLAFVSLAGGQARYAFYDEGTAGRLLAEADLPELPDSVSVLFFGGISLVGDPAASTHEALARRESRRRVIALDPNIRPAFVAGRAPEYRARICRMLALADIVKVSDEDLRWLMGEGDLAGLARQLLARGPELVFVTEGARGATAYTAGHEVFCPARPVEVADTVGAGDTFNAGALAALRARGLLTKAALPDLPEAALQAALDLGIRAASVTVSRAGANPPWAQEL